MGMIKTRVELSLHLTRSSCYFLRTGKCSLNIINDYFVSPSIPTGTGDLLYCPRLYRAMCHKEQGKPLAVIPCRCGHLEVVSGQQRACIAAQKNLELKVIAADDDACDAEPDGLKPACQICDTDQLTLDENCGGNRIVTITAHIDREE